jgi:hypothetical protein
MKSLLLQIHQSNRNDWSCLEINLIIPELIYSMNRGITPCKNLEASCNLTPPSSAGKKCVETFPIAQQEISRQYFCCRDISCWATWNIPTMFFAVGTFPVVKTLSDISCCPTGNIPTAYFAVGIFPVVQFCRDISLWHNVRIFLIGCVGTSTFPL